MGTMITRQNAEALIDEQVSQEIVQGVIKQSAALSMFRKLPNMTSNKTKMRVLDALPLAYWVDEGTNNGRKGITNASWDNKYINAAEVAVIIPIKEDVLDDAEYDIWGELKPRVIEAFGKKIDQAIFVGTDRPSSWRADLLSSVRNAGATIAQGSSTLYSAINDAMVKVEESGYVPNGIIGGVNVKGKFRMMLDTQGQPIKGTEIDSLPKAFIDNGAWDKAKSQMIIGDMQQAVYAIRQDITYKLLDQAVIQDPSTGAILYNLAQEDMVALRVTMRLGWEIPNPINAEEDDESVRFPFASIDPSTTPTTYNVTFTVKDNASTPVAVENAKIVMAGQTKLTNSSGQAVFKAVAGTYDYKVTKTGCKAQTGSTTVASAAVAVSIANFV